MVRIARYAANNAEAHNTAYQALEDLYLANGNAVEVLASETLTSDAAEINVAITGSWQWVRLITNLNKVSGSATSPEIRANSDSRTIYDWCYLYAYPGGMLGTSAGAQNGIPVNINAFVDPPSFMDLWFILSSTGFGLIGTSNFYSGGGFYTVRYGGFYNGDAVTSLQIASADVASGSTYMLQGVRA